MDTIDAARRSANMRAIRSTDTSPEMAVRRLVHGLGYRYRLHVKTLPGKPDLVFPSRGKIIFVHGCFWHQHRAGRCGKAHIPQSRADYWGPKLARNAARDKAARRRLRREGWDVLVIWECETADIAKVARRVARFLE